LNFELIIDSMTHSRIYTSRLTLYGYNNLITNDLIT